MAVAAAVALAAWGAVSAPRRRRPVPTRRAPRTATKRLHGTLLVPLLVAAFAACLVSLYVLSTVPVHFSAWWCGWVTLAFALLHTLFHLRSLGNENAAVGSLRGRRRAPPVRAADRRLRRGGELHGVITLHLVTAEGDVWVPGVMTFGPPLLLTTVVLAGYLQVGLLALALGGAARVAVERRRARPPVRGPVAGAGRDGGVRPLPAVADPGRGVLAAS